jgi:hypothetical protein
MKQIQALAIGGGRILYRNDKFAYQNDMITEAAGEGT